MDYHIPFIHWPAFVFLPFAVMNVVSASICLQTHLGACFHLPLCQQNYYVSTHVWLFGELWVVFQSTILHFCWKWSRVSASLSPCQPWLLAALLTLEGMKLQLTVHFICVFLIMNDIELYFMSQLWIRTLPLPLKKYYVKITKYILLGERKKPENGNLLNNSHYRNLEKTEKVLWRLWLEGKEAKRFRWSPEDS